MKAKTALILVGLAGLASVASAQVSAPLVAPVPGAEIYADYHVVHMPNGTSFVLPGGAPSGGADASVLAYDNLTNVCVPCLATRPRNFSWVDPADYTNGTGSGSAYFHGMTSEAFSLVGQWGAPSAPASGIPFATTSSPTSGSPT
jgi:hypothetical protein